MNSNEIRNYFLEFFKDKGHQIVPSAPMVIKNDPTLMFTNAGMNQFKDIFLGNAPIKYNRIADTQKCLRVSGKHNDLEEVGHDTYHHTMFEMLGNWSFGEYFKKEAIAWSAELLIEKFGLSKDRLYATVFEGSDSDGVGFDSEAYDYWKKILPESHILRGNKKDNFWEMGEMGPCGPCSELHFDLRDDEDRAKTDGATLVNSDNPLVIEIWNLVFIQYNRKSDGSLEQLPAKHVDTGMGFERLCMVIQGKKSNYDTDVFQPIILKISQLCGIEYGKNNKSDIAMRVIADHLRAISFSIADGQIPSNVKAGYVIRRILRRAVRYGYTYLNFREPFICKLVHTLTEQMGGQFEELKSQENLIYKVIEEEENSFLRTLSTGINMLEDIISKLNNNKKTILPGKDAFVLYDTYGFPLDLTELICKENSITINIPEFEKELEAQKNRSRNAASVETMDWVELLPCQEPVFIGYDNNKCDIKITKYREVTSKNKTLYHLVFNKTPFYGNAGGQVGEIGKIYNGDESIQIIDTIKENGLTIHITTTIPEDPTASFVAEVDLKARKASAANHTAAHLLQSALREVLGVHVEQKGSMVSSKSLRFDFSHFQKLTDEEIDDVVRHVNREIRANHPCKEDRNCPIDVAKQSGAMMLFGEKYGETVRTVKFGNSFELCGGIHAERTGDIGTFNIVSESAIAAGIRRIEAITGEESTEMIISIKSIMKDVQSMLNTPSISQAIEKLMSENNELSKKVEVFSKEKNELFKNSIKKSLENKQDNLWFAKQMELPVNVIKDIALMLYGEFSNIVFIATTISDNKPSLVVMFGKDCVKAGASASKIVKEVAKIMNGGGGGQPHIATAGGSDISKIDDVLFAAKTMAEEATK